MCGRFVFYNSVEDIERLFNVRAKIVIKPSYNIAPSQNIPVIVGDELRSLRWGIANDWGNMINARAETIEQKKTFKKAFQDSRCIILANGFYEWKDKKPRYITLKRPIFGMAGIIAQDAVAIITTKANEFMKSIHHRMPVIIPENNEKTYLNSLEKARMLLEPSNEPLRSWPVTDKMNNPGFNSMECTLDIHA